MAIILPHGVLFRGGAEERIRTKLLTDGHIDTVIGLPANLFYSTGIYLFSVAQASRLRVPAPSRCEKRFAQQATGSETLPEPAAATAAPRR